MIRIQEAQNIQIRNRIRIRNTGKIVDNMSIAEFSGEKKYCLPWTRKELRQLLEASLSKEKEDACERKMIIFARPELEYMRRYYSQLQSSRNKNELGPRHRDMASTNNAIKSIMKSVQFYVLSGLKRN